MLETRAVTTPSVVEQLLIYSDFPDVRVCITGVCPYERSSLRQSLQDGVHLLGYRCQRKLKLVLIRERAGLRGGRQEGKEKGSGK